MQKKSISEKPTWRTITQTVDDDADYPSATKKFDIGCINRALLWDAGRTWHGVRSEYIPPSPFLDRPFTPQTVRRLFDGLTAAELRRAQKTLDNAEAVCNRIAWRYIVVSPMLSTPLSADAERALAIVETTYHRLGLTRFLIFLSANGTSPWQVTDVDAMVFRRALDDAWQLEGAEETFRRNMRCWNRCAKLYPGFPQIYLKCHLRGPVQRSHNWSETPGLEGQIDAYLACGVQNLPKGEEVDWSHDDGLDLTLDHVEPLRAESIKSNKKSLRMTVRVLHDDGVSFDHLGELADLCRPARFRQAVKSFISLADGKINRTVFLRALYLMRLSRHPGVLSKDEIKLNAALIGKIAKKHRDYLKKQEDRDQKLLDQLDEPDVMDALLALPTVTRNRVLKAKRPHTIRNAYAIQCALILELWLCAPYRLRAYTMIETDQFVRMRLGGKDRVILRGPADQSRNKRAPEHFLNESAQELLTMYLADFRPLILAKFNAPDSKALFPGKGGRSKTTQRMYSQIVSYVRRNTSLSTFHPHAIRKIVPKITLDADPGALEVARRTGGWASTAMLRNVYGQRVHRASQMRYLDLLQSKRLSAIRGVVGGCGPRKSKKGGAAKSKKSGGV